MYAHCPLLPALCGEALRFSPHSNSPLSVTSRSAMHYYYTKVNNFLHVIIILLLLLLLLDFSAVARLLRSWVRIPPGAWMVVCCECCVLLGRGLCDEPITRPEESYRLWCVVVCDLETSRIGAPYIYIYI
jgi:hypothetical protein